MVTKAHLYVFVMFWDTVYKVSGARWKRYLKDKLRDPDTHIADYGSAVASKVIDITDLSAERAQDLITQAESKEYA